MRRDELKNRELVTNPAVRVISGQAEQGHDEEVAMRNRAWAVLLAGAALALGACAESKTADPSSTTPMGGGVVQFAVSHTCASGSGSDCKAIGDEHVLIIPSGFASAGVTTATPATDGSSAIDVVFDAAGAKVFSEAASQVAQRGDGGRLVLRVHDQVISAVRVPSAIAVTKMRIVLPAPLDAKDVAQEINGG